MNIGWNILMFGYKHTFAVSWRLSKGVRGLGVRGASGHGMGAGTRGQGTWG